MIDIYKQNEVKKYDGYYVSYNQETDVGAETALVIDGNFYILIGDQRELYKNTKNKEEAKKLFDESKVKRSLWSD